METPKPRNAPDSATEDRPARKSSVIQPVKRDDDVALETYEQSPERTGGDERNRPASPDGAAARSRTFDAGLIRDHTTVR